MRRIGLLLSILVIASDAAAQSQPPLRVYWYAPTAYAALIWNSVPGAAGYVVYRTTAYPSWQTIGTYTGLSYVEMLAANSAVYYKVQPVNSSGAPVGLATNAALITTYSFTDEPVTLLTTKTLVTHITELRTVINAARATAGLTAATWTNPNLSTSTPIHWQDIDDLRTAFNAALTNVGLPTPAYVDPVLSAGVPIRRDHIEELRERLRSFPEQYGTSSPAVDNPFFSPNGDGQKDNATFQDSLSFYAGTLRTDFRWIVNVRNQAGTVVRSVNGTGTNAGYTWNGRDASNVLQPEGAYTFELVDADGISIPLVTATATIDLTPPSVAITSPTSGQTFSNVRQNGSADFTVSGSATDAHFSTWTLKDGASTLATGSSAVSPAATLATWHTLTTANGSHTLTLSATDQAANTGTTTVTATVSNFSASQSAYQLNFAQGGTIAYTSLVPFTLTETISIKSLATGNTVRTLVNAQRTAASYPDVWDGKNDQGVQVPDGSYKYIATANDGTSNMTWDLSAQYVPGSAGTQFNYAKCRNDSGSLVPCDDSSIVFDPYANRPLRVNYCVGGGGTNAQNQPSTGDPDVCSGAAPVPAPVVVKSISVDPTDVTCDSTDCVLLDNQASGAHEIRWYGLTTSGSVASGNRLAVIRRFDVWPSNQALVFGTAPVITSLVIVPSILNPWALTIRTPSGQGQEFRLTIASFQSRNVSAQATFRNITSNSVLRTINLPSQPPGQISLYWDGRSDAGELVAPGTYEVAITVTDSIGSATVLRPLTTVRY